MGAKGTTTESNIGTWRGQGRKTLSRLRMWRGFGSHFWSSTTPRTTRRPGWNAFPIKKHKKYWKRQLVGAKKVLYWMSSPGHEGHRIDIDEGRELYCQLRRRCWGCRRHFIHFFFSWLSLFIAAWISPYQEVNIFEGQFNRITFEQVYTKTFKCTYQLQLYPFDTQVKYASIKRPD